MKRILIIVGAVVALVVAQLAFAAQSQTVPTDSSGNALWSANLNASGTITENGVPVLTGNGTTTYVGVFSASGTLIGYIGITYATSTGFVITGSPYQSFYKNASTVDATYGSGITGFSLNGFNPAGLTISESTGTTATIHLSDAGQIQLKTFGNESGTQIVDTTNGFTTSFDTSQETQNVNVVLPSSTSGGTLCFSSTCLTTSTNLTIANLATTSISQFANDAGYVTTTTIPSPLIVGGSQSSTITGDGSVSYIPDFDTFIYAAATSTGDYGTYLNSLCTNNTQNASSVEINVPQENVTFAQQVLDSSRCTYVGQGANATIWNWNGAQGTTMFVVSSTPTPHIVGGGLLGITLNNLGSATTTSPTVAVTIATAHIFIQYDNIIGFGTALTTANNAYDFHVDYNVMRANGQNIQSKAQLFSNSGELEDYTHNWPVDPAFNDFANCDVITGAESVVWQDNSSDDCQVVWGATGTGGDLSVAIQGGNSENAAASTNPFYPSNVPFMVIASNTETNVSLGGGFTFMNDASSTSSTPPEFLLTGAGSLSVGSVGFQRNTSNAASTTVNAILAQGVGESTACGITGNTATGNGYTNLFNGNNSITGCTTYFAGGFAGTTGYAVYNGNAGSSAFIRADAAAGIAAMIYGDSLSTEWLTGNDGTNNNLYKIASSTAGFTTGGQYLTIDRSTGKTGIGNGFAANSVPSTTLQVYGVSGGASSTLLIGSTGFASCLEMSAATGSSMGTIVYNFDSDSAGTIAFVSTTTKPSFCQ